jgi:hypothetical protein
MMSIFLKYSFCFHYYVYKLNNLNDLCKKKADSAGSGAIGALDAANFLKQSKLKDNVLKEVSYYKHH